MCSGCPRKSARSWSTGAWPKPHGCSGIQQMDLHGQFPRSTTHTADFAVKAWALPYSGRRALLGMRGPCSKEIAARGLPEARLPIPCSVSIPVDDRLGMDGDGNHPGAPRPGGWFRAGAHHEKAPGRRTEAFFTGHRPALRTRSSACGSWCGTSCCWSGA